MIGIAAVFGAISIFAADFWVKSQAKAESEQKVASIVAPPQEPKVEFKTIVVAQAPLRYGVQLDRSQLTEIPWPQDSLPQGAFPTIDKLLAEGSRVVLSPIEVNEPVLLTKLSGPNGRATLSNMLSPGMRAVTIRTDEIAGVGGFITPGDRVDVVLTRDAGEIQEVAKNAQGASGSTVTSEIVVSDAKVLSVGQGADERKTEPQIANSVTLEVTNEGAQKVALARTVGTLSLSLRSAADASAGGNGLTTISSFGGSVAASAEASAASLVNAVAKGPEEPKFKTVIVSRGEKVEEYKVPSKPGEGDVVPSKEQEQ
ncbi:Flp pilus assembly protein CpaB [Mesorhizobium sp. M1C.F.Ca.ET.193.01.1.1]|nr:Flp pilus assembly protein CpaB [Mesorhizobium sp. M1C.F.Ca.ET.210.01.1.1]TGQ72269.1 Flp pilus assembly protein CpaB [Mesorhizobium sp. M1C.F.Ca.ET.212.01.1.1]TGR10085.1 Flp pilus assembly protein CpaB [Mesorhizobium sp. M1C.F.Ca.ET.204.01.1.1]TGR30205.1 Flp pilus assembly protein CpaB [Mesorhizobium sp. M1C.F.Ca.ET.196.01.1.1]TGR52733.1 Flp pilus assembly protein CpaB [Mesorhizobium sp. M1C.F.Ca.ET.195.01.1.1]TGR66531.1 Flp pilus assembly protein CpaB [Mesorhizobium sp. M1C.F.Ca.ET.192.01.